MKTVKKALMFINGEWVGDKLDTFKVVNPATGEVVGTVPSGGYEEAAQAIEAADEAFPSWSQATAYERATFLKKFHQLILENKEELAQTMTLEMGKPIKE